jgi:hypothetical protein
MSRISLSELPIPQSPNFKEQTANKLSQSQLQNYVTTLGEREKEFINVLNTSLSNSLNFTSEQLASKEMLKDEEKAQNYKNRFFTKDYDEELDYYAKQAGLESQGKIYFTEDDKIATGYMGYFEANDAGSMFGGNFELLTSNAATLRRKTQMMGSDALLQTSKAWKAIENTVKTTDVDKEYYQRQLKNSNNWERWVNINSAESLAQAVPIVDILFTTIGEQTPEEVLLKRKDPNFDGKTLVDTILKEDPEFFSFLKSEGVNMESLATATNPYHFKYLINSTVQANAISRSLQTAEQYHTTAANWALFGLEQARGSLGSGDFVGQVALTVGTAGLGLAVSGIATAATYLTTADRVAAGLKASETAINLAKAGQLVTNMRNFLPANIPSTLVHKFLPQAVNKGMLATGGLWLGGQAIEGFLEEGITDAWNQVYELNEGTRLSYNFGQTWEAAYMGALMEPVLGGALTGITIPVTITTSLVGSTLGDFSTSLFSGTFNIEPTRFKELNLYFDAFMGKFESLSPEERQIRIGTITASLVTEAALNQSTNNQFGKTEKNMNFIGKLFQVLNDDKVLDASNVAFITLSGLAVRLSKLHSDINKNIKLSEVDGTKVLQIGDVTIPYSPELENLINYTDGQFAFTKEGAELMMATMLADSQGNSDTRESNISDIVLFLAKEKLQKELKLANPTLNDEQLEDLVLKTIETEGDNRYTAIRDGINASFRIISDIYNTSQQAENESKLEMPKPDSQVVQTVVKQRQEIRQSIIKEVASVSSTPEAATGIPELLAKPIETETTSPKPWSMMDDVTSVETSPTAVEVAPTVAETAPVVTEADPMVTKPITTTPTTKELDAKELEALLSSLPIELQINLKNTKGC